MPEANPPTDAPQPPDRPAPGVRRLPAIARALGRGLVKAAGGLLLFAVWVWAAFGLLYSELPGAWLRAGLAAAVGLGLPLALARLPGRRRTALAFLGCVALPLLLYRLSLTPSNDRDWSPDQAVLPHAEFDGPRVTVRNVRRCEYVSPSEYTVRHEDRTFDLADVETVDFVVEPFSAWEGAAHTFLTFGLRGGDYLAVSAEIRRERGESFSAWRGLFKQYEVMYVVGDERDLVRLRTDFRGHAVYLYPVRATPAQARALLVSMLGRANALRERPEFYDTLTNTCTTNIIAHLDELTGGRVPLDARVLFPGYSDRLAYELGLIDADAPFEEVKARCRIDGRARAAGGGPDFSRAIRRPR